MDLDLSKIPSNPVFIFVSEQISKRTSKMMKNIGILVSVLLAFLLNVEAIRAKSNVEALDFSRCDSLSDYDAKKQCKVEGCGYSDDPTACQEYDLAHYGLVAVKTGISLMVFTIFLIIVVLIEKVNENTPLYDYMTFTGATLYTL